MPVAKGSLIFLLQSVISPSTFSLAILPSIIEDQNSRVDQCGTKHAKIDRVAGDVARTIDMSV